MFVEQMDDVMMLLFGSKLSLQWTLYLQTEEMDDF
jgi:hypothetical protein